MNVVLTEKPSVARELAVFLGADQRRDGYFEGNGYCVAWALGHLVELCEPQDYDPAWRKWTLDVLPIVPPKFRLKVIGDGATRRQFEIVRRLLQEADEIIAATDAGREGELIFRYILEQAGLERRRFHRLWLNSLNPAAIRHAFQNLRPGSEFDSLYAAARCRSQADWIVGLNATRNLTVRHGGQGLLWSVGRVQTPVLALIVARDDEILAFRPEPFYELWTTYRQTPFKYAGDRFAKQEDAATLLAQVVDRPFCVTKVETSRRTEPPPQLYDLTDLQRDMNRRWGLSADRTLKAAQRLYEAKAITYPRTDSRYLTNDMKEEVRKTLQRLQPHRPSEIGKLDLAELPFTGRIVNNAKVTDHHAILPTGEWRSTLSGVEAKVFDAVVTRLIAAFYPPCIKLLTTVHAKVEQIPFRTTGVQVLDPGWTALYPRKLQTRESAAGASRNSREDARMAEADLPSDDTHDDSSLPSHSPTSRDQEERLLPPFQVGEHGPHEPSIRQGETKPPPHFTENTLLAAMETAGKLVGDDELKEALKERGLGTPATRASIIETLIARNYVQREKKSLKATNLGRYLIALIRHPQLKSAELTGAWEARLKQIEHGRLNPDVFMEDIIRFTDQIVRSDDLHPVDPERLGDCPRCGAPVVEGKRDFGCSRWREGCTFVLRRELDGIPLDVGQIRLLLQRRLIAWPPTGEQAGQMYLYLSDTGAVFPLDPPSAQTPFKPQSSGRRTRSGGRRGATRAKSRTGVQRRRRTGSGSSAASPTQDKSTGEKSAIRDASDTLEKIVAKYARRPPTEATSGSRSPGVNSLGACPLCGRPVVEQTKSFSCSGWREGCAFTIWRNIAGKRITRRTAETLVRKGRTTRLKGFRSKAGKPFEARLQLVDGQVKLAFDEE